ncbi:MAG TPA: hypothetical protein VMS17_10965 [Gemmataceae bacterium]|nr:hypothetical protein [Gemmataceae bacterium]
MNLLTATLKDGRRVPYRPEQIGEGGMKRVFFTADRQSVVCFFKDARLKTDRNRLERLEKILGPFNPTADPQTGKHFAELFCWPTAIVMEPQFGVLAPAYSKNFFFKTGPWQGKEKEGKWFSSPKLRKMLPPAERGDWANYLAMCIPMARAVRKLHLTGLAHSDLSSRNVLVDPPGGRCAVIDIDSLVVPGIYPPDVLGTPGFIAPEVLKTQHLPMGDRNRRLPSNLTDLHALAVLLYEYLLRRHPLRGPKVNGQTAEEDELLSMGSKSLWIEDPHDESNRVDVNVPYRKLGPYLSGLFHRAFVEGLHHPTTRPGAAEWESALARSADLLIPCGNPACEEKAFLYCPDEAPVCPWCRWQLKEPVPVLELHYAPPGRRGQYRPEGHRVVGHDGKRLYRWHTHRHVGFAEGAEAALQAVVLRQEDQWILANYNLHGMVSPAGNPVPVGRGCPLRDGDEVVLSGDEHGRIAVVRMIP